MFRSYVLEFKCAGDRFAYPVMMGSDYINLDGFPENTLTVKEFAEGMFLDKRTAQSVTIGRTRWWIVGCDLLIA